MFRRYVVAIGLLLLIPLITAAVGRQRDATGPRSPDFDFDRVISTHADDIKSL
jgi:hypothetical protein